LLKYRAQGAGGKNPKSLQKTDGIVHKEKIKKQQRKERKREIGVTPSQGDERGGDPKSHRVKNA